MRLPLLITGLLAATTNALAIEYFFISLEQNNAQTNAAEVTERNHEFYATVEGTGFPYGTVSVNGGPEHTLVDEGDFLEYSQTFSSESALTTFAPLGGTYTLGGYNDNIPSATPINITGPGGAFADRLPTAPRFTISGVTGTWSTVLDGNNLPVGIFTFDPTSVTSFTVTLNAFDTPTDGAFYGGFASVGSVNGNVYSEIDEAGSGPDALPGSPTTTTLTFTKGLADNAGDGDPLTYGFVDGNTFELEGGFFNIVSLTETGLGDGSEKGFIFGNTTSFLLKADSSAIPEPSSYAALIGGLALAGALLRRRR